MKCIFCLKERPGTEEHIFPRAIGGKLTTDRVCKLCNSSFGSKVDAALSDNFLVRGHRARLRLAGNSGEPPAMHELLLGVGRLAENPSIRVEVRFDECEQKIVTRTLHHASDAIMPDGSKARKIVVDEKDAGDLPKIIQRERERHGVPPLSVEALEAEVSRFRDNVTVINNPKVLFERSYSFAFVRHAMIKIAYELAFLWLGEDYINDPSAAELRDVIHSADPNSTDKLPAYVADAEGFEAFKLWPSNETEHLAYAFAGDDGIAIAVRVFNIHAAFVWVTKDPTRYLSGRDAGQRLRFLCMDAITGQKRDVPMMDELARIAAAIVVSRNNEIVKSDDLSY